MPDTKERDRFGLLTRESFLSCVQNQLHSKINNTTCIAAVDIEHMKLLNNWFGQQTGDRVLRRIASILLNMEEENGYLVGRFGSDDFFLFMPSEEARIQQVYEDVSTAIEKECPRANFRP